MNKVGFGKNKAPRTLEEINKEYSQASGKAANTQYLIYVYTKELEQVNKRMLELNQEAAERNKLTSEEAQRQSAAKQSDLKAVENVKS